ncbi:MAG: outer membrane beta-barrel protein [Cryomorphaceae bacterium]|nr:PorT family protein [Flavobacteriales bacterium]
MPKNPSLFAIAAILTATLFCTDMQAQSDGVYVHGGLSLSTVRNDAGNVNFNKINLLGGVGTLSFEDDHLYFGGELNIVQKGVRSVGVTANQFDQTRADLYYAQIAGFAGYKFDDHWSIFLGPALGYAIFVNEANVFTPNNQPTEFRDIELSAMAGIRYQFSERLGVMLRFEHSVLPVIKVPSEISNVRGARAYHALAGVSLFYSFN